LYNNFKLCCAGWARFQPSFIIPFSLIFPIPKTASTLPFCIIDILGRENNEQALGLCRAFFDIGTGFSPTFMVIEKCFFLPE
jgi:hypothetical protein